MSPTRRNNVAKRCDRETITWADCHLPLSSSCCIAGTNHSFHNALARSRSPTLSTRAQQPPHLSPPHIASHSLSVTGPLLPHIHEICIPSILYSYYLSGVAVRRPSPSLCPTKLGKLYPLPPQTDLPSLQSKLYYYTAQYVSCSAHTCIRRTPYVYHLQIRTSAQLLLVGARPFPHSQHIGGEGEDTMTGGSSSFSGTKRKWTAPAFYAVKTGFIPGIYQSKCPQNGTGCLVSFYITRLDTWLRHMDFVYTSDSTGHICCCT